MAQLTGTAHGIVGAIRKADPELIAKHRQQLPELWDRLEEARGHECRTDRTR